MVLPFPPGRVHCLACRGPCVLPTHGTQELTSYELPAANPSPWRTQAYSKGLGELTSAGLKTATKSPAEQGGCPPSPNQTAPCEGEPAVPSALAGESELAL
ncbi:hypothetical protein KIL84_010213 [Mauremys mutica]|uniref:Uncharacterized protein n=1 Tax=Mauremys mutica TaxID=74926 RepID=A0A9D4B6X3_9SAUR|nr:hypothetical protein KIL84_010213 [Mauremys mutica]